MRMRVKTGWVSREKASATCPRTDRGGRKGGRRSRSSQVRRPERVSQVHRANKIVEPRVRLISGEVQRRRAKEPLGVGVVLIRQ